MAPPSPPKKYSRENALARTPSQTFSVGAKQLELPAQLNPLSGPRAALVREILRPNLRARMGILGSTATTECANSLAPQAFQTPRKTPTLYKRHGSDTPPNCTGGATALKLRVRGSTRNIR